MKYKKYDVEDFLADKNFINWIAHPSAESDKYWREFIGSYPEKREVIEEAIDLLKLIQFRKLPASDQQKDRILRNTIALNYSDRSKSTKGPPKKNNGLKLKQIAAIILIFISAAAFLTYQFSGRNDTTSAGSADKIEMITKQNPAGRKSRFYLPDGSFVTLNADSKIEFYGDFKQKREVWLTGEASFDVKESLESDFLVHTKNLNIFVTGTTFNVSAFVDDAHESISLLTGKVNVSCNNDHLDEAYQLIPGEKLSVDLISNESSVSDLRMEEVLWSSGILVFKNDDLETFAKKIYRWYGVEVEVSGSPKLEININGKFDNESLTNVLEGLKFSVGIDYQFIDHKVNIQF